MTNSLSSVGAQAASTAMFQRVGSLGMPSMESAEDIGAGFESMFMSMLVKEMRQTLPEGLFGKESSDVYGGMFDMYLGQHLADSQSLGIKEMVMSQPELRKLAS